MMVFYCESMESKRTSFSRHVLVGLIDLFFEFLIFQVKRQKLYTKRQSALKTLFELDAATLKKAGLTYDDIRWEARLPLKLNTEEKIQEWQRLGLIE